MKLPPILVPVLLLAACGDQGVVSPEGRVTTNQIERLSTPKEDRPDPLRRVRLQPVPAAELAGLRQRRPNCAFFVGEAPVLVAVPGGALVRIAGITRRLVITAPIGPTGGFFEDLRTGVSVGRIEEVGEDVEDPTGWPARIEVTDRRSDARLELRGIWTCNA